MKDIILELIRYVFAGKRWWIVPIVLFLIVLGGLIVLSGSSPLAPFIYTLF